MASISQRRIWFAISLAIIILFVVLVRLSLPLSRETFTNTTPNSKCVYDQTSFTSNNRVVLYYAPWCSQCTEFKPEFDKAASQAMSLGLDVCFVTVNSDSQKNDCTKVKGATVLPTVQLEVGADPVPPFTIYNGLRNANDLLSWVKTSLPLKQA